MIYLILFWLVSGFISANWIYLKIYFNINNPEFPRASLFVYFWLLFLGIILGAYLALRASDDEWIEGLLEELEKIN